MLRLLHRSRRWLPLAYGLVLGFVVTVWTSVYAAVLLPNLSLSGVISGSTVSGIVALGAQADGAGLAGVQFQVSGQNIGAEITSGSCSVAWDTSTLPNGSRTLTAVGRDSAGNTIVTPAVLVNIQNTSAADTTAPTVGITAPSAGSTVSGTSMLTATATDAVGVAGVWFTLDGSNVGTESATAPYQTSWPTTTAANGTHVLRAFARDAAGNTAGSSSVTVTVNNVVSDTTAPTVSLSGPAAGTTLSGSVTVSAVATDNVGVASVQITLDGANLGSADTSTPYSTVWATTGASNGSHVLRAVARDAAGNAATSAPVTVIVNNSTADVVAPTVSVSSPAAGTTVSGSVTITASATDNVSLAGVQFKLDGASLGAEDTVAPYSTTWVTTSTTNAAHSLTAVARDASGNTSTSFPVVVTVNNSTPDTTMPSVSLTAPSSGSTVVGAVTVAASASDNIAVVGVQFTIDGSNLGAEVMSPGYSVAWNTASVSNGSHTLRAVARDAAGNRRTSSARTVTVNNPAPDTTAPSVSVTTPASGASVSGSVTVAATASDNLGVASVQFTLDGNNLGAADAAAPFTTSWSSTAATNGSHVLRAIARDAAGNTTTSGPVTVMVSNSTPDTTAPAVSITAPSSGAAVSGTVSIGANASDNVAVVGVQFTLDGAVLGSEDTTAPYATTWSSAAAANGAHVLRAIARDAAGNGTTSAPVTVTVNNATQDTVLPAVSISSPAKGATLNGAVTITATASDNVGVAGVQFMMDGITFGAEDTTAPYQITWTTGAVPNGTYQLSAVARDAAGNRRTAATVTVTVDNTVAAKAVAGDLDGDGSPDLLWENASGRMYAWLMNSSQLIGQGPLDPGAVDPSWQVASVDDFDGDGKNDLLWENMATGQLYIWLMDRMALSGSLPIGTSAAAGSWRVMTTGDFNGDGKADLILEQTDTGALAAVFMDGGTVLGSAFLTPSHVDPNWVLVGSGDINRDGKPDLVWQNVSNGQLVAWYMNGLAATQTVALTPSVVAPTWRIKAVADFNRDGNVDLVWQSASGLIYIWYMNGPVMTSGDYLGPGAVDISWQIVGGR